MEHVTYFWLPHREGQCPPVSQLYSLVLSAPVMSTPGSHLDNSQHWVIFQCPSAGMLQRTSFLLQGCHRVAMRGMTAREHLCPVYAIH